MTIQGGKRMYRVRVEVYCPRCGKLHFTRTIRSETEKALGTIGCSGCGKRFEYRIYGPSVQTSPK